MKYVINNVKIVRCKRMEEKSCADLSCTYPFTDVNQTRSLSYRKMLNSENFNVHI